MKVVITGATGFIGGALARRLADEGANVHALAQPGSNRGRLQGCPITWRDGDITGATIPEDAIVGRAFVIFWPVGRATWLTVPNTFDKVPDPK